MVHHHNTPDYVYNPFRSPFSSRHTDAKKRSALDSPCFHHQAASLILFFIRLVYQKKRASPPFAEGKCIPHGVTLRLFVSAPIFNLLNPFSIFPLSFLRPSSGFHELDLCWRIVWKVGGHKVFRGAWMGERAVVRAS